MQDLHAIRFFLRMPNSFGLDCIEQGMIIVPCNIDSIRIIALSKRAAAAHKISSSPSQLTLDSLPIISTVKTNSTCKHSAYRVRFLPHLCTPRPLPKQLTLIHLNFKLNYLYFSGNRRLVHSCLCVFNDQLWAYQPLIFSSWHRVGSYTTKFPACLCIKHLTLSKNSICRRRHESFWERWPSYAKISYQCCYIYSIPWFK